MALLSDGAVVSSAGEGGEIEAKHRDRMSAYAAAFADTMAVAREQVTYLDGLRVETRLQREPAEAMAPYDALICPTTVVPSLPAGDDLLGRLVVNGEESSAAPTTTRPSSASARPWTYTPDHRPTDR
ncbi:hypothetical protein ACWFR1_35015 [Streptomyces sp. NPDC055103]